MGVSSSSCWQTPQPPECLLKLSLDYIHYIQSHLAGTELIKMLPISFMSAESHQQKRRISPTLSYIIPGVGYLCLSRTECHIARGPITAAISSHINFIKVRLFSLCLKVCINRSVQENFRTLIEGTATGC